MNTQSRLRSKVAWASVATLVLFVLKTYGLLEGIGLSEDSYKELTTLVFGVALAFGVFNNPTSKDSF